MSTLFNNNNSENGYRLRCLEVFNWGTFHGKVYKLQTNGRTSLLTGANGSGKTTLIDALLTLLVPSNKRFYNQSSGAEFKKERDENSYFWGYYGKTYSESDEISRTEQLRNKSDNPYSVLLACFQNTGTLHTITLVQVRWFSGGALKKIFIVSPYQLNINEHFGKGHFDIKGEWKKKLVKQFPKTDLFDNFKEYAARFSDIFGLKEKALSLFNQTVGIKVLGDLTQFIRQQMLGEPEAEEQFKSLYNHYTDLLLSHKAIQKDEKQLELLEPIIKIKEALSELYQKVSVLNFIQEQFPYFVDKIEFELLDEYISDVEKQIAYLENEKKVLEEQIDKLDQEQRQLISQKALLNIDNQVQLINKDIFAETDKRNTKKQSFEDYIKLARVIGLQLQLDVTSFRENFDTAEKLHKTLSEEYDELTEKRTRYKIDRDANAQQIQQLQDEITSLLSRKNRIPIDLISVRQRLLDLLETGEAELPFVGELIKVKENNAHWEDAIERVLHSFSMQLLIPEKFSKQINQFVHANNLQTKLIYQKIEKRHLDTLMRWPNDNDSLINKIEIKDSGNYTNWLEYQLLERLNYYCTDDLDIFYGSAKAVTSNGLTRNVSRHEKDDRPNNWNKFRYRLGWDNKETVKLVQQEKYRLEKEHTDLFNKIEALKPKIQVIDEKKPITTLITGIKSYDTINWQQHAEKIQGLNKQIEDLKKSSDKYQTICDQLYIVDEELKAKRKINENHGGEIKSLRREYDEKNKRKINISFEDLKEEGITQIENFVQEESIKNAIPKNLEVLEGFRKELSATLKLRNNSISTVVKEKEFETVSYINAFVHADGKILKEFPDWSGDVMNIDANLKSIGELDDLYRTIRNQRLVEHKRRFKDYMDKSMLDALTNFRTWLVNEEDKIKEVIEELNVPLKKITFNKNPDTYLQLECRATKEQEIKLFKEQLSATIPNTLEFATQKDETYRESIFKKIKDLITDLQQEEVWRKKVTDIRNWLTFSAREYSLSENKAGQYHDNTASYSGGQKAQFTYAVLGAAIAHQFGIFQMGKQHKSLRFITVDEAFSKLDPEKSQFLMEFCAQLNLQILVVTPLDKINIAEPYINAVHFVEIKNKNNSIVYNLTMEEYYERKEEFNQLAENIE